MPKKFLKRYTPNEKQIKDNRLLSMLGHYLYRPTLWQINRHVVARAFAVGLFCTWIPFPFQSLVASALAIFFSANLPISVALVFVTNPITIPLFFYFAYWLGTVILGQTVVITSFELSKEWFHSVFSVIWEPLLVGSFSLGIISSVIGYYAIHLIWRLHIYQRWKNRHTERKQQKANKVASKSPKLAQRNQDST